MPPEDLAQDVARHQVAAAAEYYMIIRDSIPTRLGWVVQMFPKGSGLLSQPSLPAPHLAQHSKRSPSLVPQAFRR